MFGIQGIQNNQNIQHIRHPLDISPASLCSYRHTNRPFIDEDPLEELEKLCGTRNGLFSRHVQIIDT